MRFSIRDVFWLTLCCALILGWYTDRANQDKVIKQLNSSVNKLSWRVYDLRVEKSLHWANIFDKERLP